MKFLVSRVTCCDDSKPCDDATLEQIVFVDVRNTDDVSKYSWGERWLRGGRNHRVENGKSKRDLDRKAWVIEFNSLEDLLQFITRIGERVIIDYEDNNYPKITIYDNYIE